MSNKSVPLIYRRIIDEVIDAIRPEFDEYGVGEDVLEDLQRRWENKVIASHVAEFEPPLPQQQAAPQHHYPPHVPHPSLPNVHPGYHPQFVTPPQPQVQPVKSEPVENGFPTNGIRSYLPPLPGPSLPSQPRSGSMIPHVPHHYGTTPTNGVPRLSYPVSQSNAPSSTTQSQSQQPQTMIPQVDGPSSSPSESPSPPSYAPRASHPSLPQPTQGHKPLTESEEINSDLDDSDTDGEEDDQEGTLGETDIMFCTYDKVARVKNKWKCILKEGMIHVNGKDYLFAKCTCEFEW